MTGSPSFSASENAASPPFGDGGACRFESSSDRGSQWSPFVLVIVLLGAVSVLGTVAPQAGHAQGKRLTVHSESQFWIQGKATTHEFTCGVARVDGRARLPDPEGTVPTEADDQQTTVVVTVPVEAFDCGNRPMTNDLKETLEMEDHPEIRFELVHATVGAALDTSGQWRQIEILGTLTIAGKKRLTRLQAAGQALDQNRFRVRGCHPLRMTFFDIEPPTKAFGLIKVKDRIEVQFDLLAHTTDQESEETFDSITVSEAPSCPVVEGTESFSSAP